MKKYLALLLVLVMALGLFAGCNNTETPANTGDTSANTPSQSTPNSSEDEPQPKDPVTLYWYTRGPGVQTNTEHVNEEFNKLLQTYEGFEHLSIKFMPYTGGEYPAAVQNAYTAKEQIDIVCTVSLNPVDYARDGYFIALDDLLAEHQDLWNELPEWLWMTQYVDDGIYVVPNYQRGNNPAVVGMNAEWAKLCDWKGLCDLMSWQGGREGSKGSIEEVMNKMEECLLAVREATGNDKIYLNYASGLMGITTKYEFLDANGWDQGSSAFANPFSDDLTVEMPYFNEEWLTMWKIACEWKDKGYFPADIIGAESNTYTFQNGDYLFNIGQTITLDQEGADDYMSNAAGFECVTTIPHGFAYMENRWAAGGNAISATCEHPEDAIAFLDLINTEKGAALYNMVVWGIEGEDYEKVGENRIKTLYYDGSQAGSDAPYSANNWCVGNTFNGYLNQATPDEMIAWALEINNTAEGCPWSGVRLDTIDVSNEVSNMKALCAEVLDRIRWGVDGVAGYEAAVAEIQSKAIAAGALKIMNELQEQLDDYMASK